MPVPDLLSIIADSSAVLGVAFGYYALHGWTKANRRAGDVAASLDKAERECKTAKHQLGQTRDALKEAQNRCKIGFSGWREAENELALYRADEPARAAAAVSKHCSRIGRKGAPIGNKSPVRAAKRAAMRVEG